MQSSNNIGLFSDSHKHFMVIRRISATEIADGLLANIFRGFPAAGLSRVCRRPAV